MNLHPSKKFLKLALAHRKQEREDGPTLTFLLKAKLEIEQKARAKWNAASARINKQINKK